MAVEFILAHDLGTTGNKASLYDGRGKVLASSFYGYTTQFPNPGWVEQNPEDWWQAVCVSTSQLLSSTRVPAKNIACIVFSGQMMGCVAVDRLGRPLRNAMIWADGRATQEADRLGETLGFENAYRITGHRISPNYASPKMVWIRNHQPEIFAQVHKFLLAKDFIVLRLTGKFVSDFTDAASMNLIDLHTWNWSPPILEALQLKPSRLPELHASTDVVGEVLPAVAEETGLAAGTPVVIGGGDGLCATVGAGVVRPGSAYTYIGSSTWIAITTPEPLLDPLMRTFTWLHMLPGMYSPTGTMQAGGGSYQWLRDALCPQEKETARQLDLSAYELMNLEALKSPAGARGLLFLPYLLGERSPRWNPKARGAYLGLSMQHNRADIIRATLEGVALNMRVILEAFQAQGARIDSMRLIGGGARSSLWRQIMADIYNLPVLCPALLEEATSLGAAIAGGIGVGLFKDFQVAETLTPILDTTQPNLANQPLYNDLYRLFNQAYDALEPLYEQLAKI